MNGALDHSDQPDPDAIKMFVGQIPRSWSEKELKELFEPYGAVYQINVLRDRSQNPPQSKGTVVLLSLLSVCLFSRWSCLPSAFPKRFALCSVVCSVELCSSPKRRGLLNPIRYCLPPLLKLKFNSLLSGSINSNCKKKKRIIALLV